MGRGRNSRRQGLSAAIAGLALTTLACLTLAAAGSPTKAFACEHVNASTKSLSKAKASEAMRCLINGARRHHGLNKLRANGALTEVAQKHTRVMKRKGCFSHQCPGESDLLGRIRRSGYLAGVGAYSFAENIAYSGRRGSSPRAVFKDWMRSSGHRTNILSPRSRHIGIGVSASRRKALWTTDFGSRG